MTNEYITTRDNIFFLCYFMEMLGRKSRVRKTDIMEKMDRDFFLNMCEIEDVYHSLNPDQLIYEQKKKLNLRNGRHNRIDTANYKVPSIDAMAELYTMLIYRIGGDITDAFFKVMSSPITDYIDDYNSSLYYENPDYIAECIREGKIIINYPI